MYQKTLKFWSIPWLHFHIYLFVLLPVPILQWPLAPGPGIQFLMNYEEQVNTPFSQATNEFHAGSDTRCDEENDFDAIFGIVLLPSHTHNYAQSFSTIGVGIFAFLSQEREREKKVFRNLQNNPSNVKVINLMFNFSSSYAPLTLSLSFHNVKALFNSQHSDGKWPFLPRSKITLEDVTHAKSSFEFIVWGALPISFASENFKIWPKIIPIPVFLHPKYHSLSDTAERLHRLCTYIIASLGPNYWRPRGRHAVLPDFKNDPIKMSH